MIGLRPLNTCMGTKVVRNVPFTETLRQRVRSVDYEFMQVELLCRVKRDRRPEHQMFVMTPPTGGLQNIASSVRLGSQQVRRLV